MPEKVVQIPGVGNVAFPEAMSDQDIAETINTKILPGGSSAYNPPPAGKPPVLDMKPDPVPGLLGRLANAGSGALGGAQLGAMFGGVPAAVGAVAGGGLGALLPPSDHPGMETGANIANLFLDRVLPGAGSASRLRRLFRAGGVLAGTAGGGYAGSLVDRTDTPWGEIALFSGLSAVPEAMKAMTATPLVPNATAAAADRLGGYPLSLVEGSNAPAKLEEIFMGGSSAAKDLAARQTAAGQAVIQRIMGAPLSDSIDVIQSGVGAKQTGRRIVRSWVDAWNADPANKVTTTVATPSNPLTGTAAGTATKTTIKPPDWVKFEKDMGLDAVAAQMGIPTKDLRDAFFRTMRVDPEQVVNQFIPGTKNQVKGLLKLRALTTVLTNSGKTVEVGRLNQAVVMHYLGDVFRGEVTNGAEASRRILNAIGKGSQPGMLQVVLDPKRVAALEDLATVLRESNPVEKMGGVSEAQRTGGYLYHKLAFGAASGMAVEGGHQYEQGTGIEPLRFVLGAAGGAGMVIAGSSILGAIMANPASSKKLVAAARGSATAATAFIRGLVSADWSKNDEEGPEATVGHARDRLAGLFVRR